MASRAVIWDRVHDLVQLPKVVKRAIDTPEFQRLRLLKQLGIVSYVFPGAAHTRFEHSIGVAHLARTLAHTLRENQPDIAAELSPRDEELVMLAGLCHDVGHGPFSHLFEDVIAKNLGVAYDHEVMSVKLTRRMLQGLLSDTEVDDVVGIMSGAGKGDGGKLVNRWSGPRGVLCDIVSNKRCGVDVDKLDYFLRDSLSCYGRPTVDARYARLFHGARAVTGCSDDAPDQWRLAFSTKVSRDLRELWTLRAKLHAGVYQTPVVKSVGHMIGDALQLAEPYYLVDGKSVRLRDCLLDGKEDQFLTLGDWIVDAVAASADPALAPAIRVLHRLRARELYPRVGGVVLSPEAPKPSEAQIAAAVLSKVPDADMRERVRQLLLVDVAFLTPAKAPADDPLRKVTWVNLKGAASESNKLVPLKLSGVPLPSVFAPATHTERHVVFLTRWESLTHSVDGVTLETDVRQAAVAACAEWVAEQRQAGFGVPETLVRA